MDKTKKNPESLFKVCHDLQALFSLCGFMHEKDIPIPIKIHYMMSDMAKELSEGCDFMLDSRYNGTEDTTSTTD